jgi:MFS-type transporter involved in bile tolerance (Atg22 family)
LGEENDEIDVVAYTIYEFASKVTNYSFGFFIPILIANLGNIQYGNGTGNIIWGYVSAAISITSVLAYLTFTPVIEFNNLKRLALINCSLICAILHIAFIICFFGPSIYLAILFAIFAKTLQRVCDVAFESMLEVVSNGKDRHQISGRCNVAGYVGMLAFLFFVLPVVAVLYFGFKLNNLWTEGIGPICCVGIWYISFLYVVEIMLDKNIGLGPKIPIEMDGNVFEIIAKSFMLGLKEQIVNVKYMYKLTDLSLFFLCYVFLAGGASTAISVGAILAVNVLKISLVFVGIAFFVAIISAIVGVEVYKWLHRKKFLSPKQILLINMVFLLLTALYVLKLETTLDLMVVALVAGFQTGFAFFLFFCVFLFFFLFVYGFYLTFIFYF